jgi:hypothetical protein
MPKITDKELVRISPRIYLEDAERLKLLSTPNTSVHKIIREVLHTFLDSSFDRLRTRIDKIQGTENLKDQIIWPELHTDQPAGDP